MAQHVVHGRTLGTHVLMLILNLFRITSVRGGSMDRKADLMLDQLARAINLQTLKDFYSDPKNIKKFEEWKKEKANLKQRNAKEK